MASSIERKLAAYNDILLLIARILIAILFLVAAYNKFSNLAGTTAYFTNLKFPSPQIVAPVIATVELALGVLVLAGIKTRLTALAIVAFVIAAALIAHMDWKAAGQLANFTKNLAIAGGCLALFITGAGAYSVDAKQRW